ncbi:MAG TPA: ATP-binding protein, partial [Lachnospiraceae bacterium]|nr:ATP-binding protein [Lachnospiraceae bacterium]
IGESWISIIRKGNQVCIIIEDDGPGVGQEELSKLFQVFYRSDRSRSNPNRGSGLGLAITAKAINYMGGNIYAENREPNGLRIIIELSIAKDTGMQDELIQDSRMQRGGEI